MQINTTQITAMADAIREILGDDEDSAAFWDTLDGEADALDIADRLLRQRGEAKALSAAAKAQADEITARSKRFQDRAAACDRALRILLNAAGERKMERPGATVSIRKGAMSVAITDDSQIPTQFCKTTVAPDKTAIKAQLQAGEDVPGAELVRGEDGVTVRVK